MSTLLELSGRPERANAILAAVRRIVAEERRPLAAEVDSICKDLPHWDPCGDDECQAALALVIEQAERDMQQRFQAESAQPAEPQTSVVEEQPLLSHDDYVKRLRRLNADLAATRADLVRQDHLVREARGLVADALQAWVSGGVKISRTEAVREVIATTQAVRAQRAGYRNPNNDGTAFLQKQMRRGRRRVGRGDVWTANGIARMKLPSEL